MILDVTTAIVLEHNKPCPEKTVNLINVCVLAADVVEIALCHVFGHIIYFEDKKRTLN